MANPITPPAVKQQSQTIYVLDGREAIDKAELRWKELLLAAMNTTHPEVYCHDVAASFFDLKVWTNLEKVTDLKRALQEHLPTFRERLENTEPEDEGAPPPEPIFTFPIAADGGRAWGNGRRAEGLRAICNDDPQLKQYLELRQSLWKGAFAATVARLNGAVKNKQLTAKERRKLLKAGGDAFGPDSLPSPRK